MLESSVIIKRKRGVTDLVLAIDVGNSSTTVGLFDEIGELVFRSVLSTYKRSTQEQWAIQLMDVFRLHQKKLDIVTGTILASVVPPVTMAIYDAITFLTGRKPLVMGPGVKTGLNIRSDLHAQLGSDIVASSVAAINKYQAPIIVIDMGTAISMSLLLDHAFEGCVIMPGVRVAVEALSREAAALPYISIEQPESILGRNTVDAMRSGVIYGNASMVDGMIDRIEEASGTPIVTVVATGAASPEILSQCKRNILYDADLLLDGLYLIYQKNTTSRAKKA